MVYPDLQQWRFGSLEFRNVVYGPNSGGSFCGYAGLTYWSDQRYHTDLYLECSL
jgi:hypothetical protein